MSTHDPDSAENWGDAGMFMLGWALAFYRDGDDDPGNRHLAIAINDFRISARLANARLDGHD